MMGYFLMAASLSNHCQTSTYAFVPTRTQYQTSMRRSTNTVVAAAVGDNDDWFQQRRGESDINFIKRLTSQAPPDKTTQVLPATTTPTKGYQRIEDWESEQKELQKNGTMTWEERVQFDGLRNGNQIRQLDILMRQINSGL
jgi:hypothetical protein